MRRSGGAWQRLPVLRRGVRGIAVMLFVSAGMQAQNLTQGELAKKVQVLTEAMGKAQAQLEQSQQQLNDLRRQLDGVRRQMNGGTADADPDPSPNTGTAAEDLAAQVAALKENQAVMQSEIATHEQSKVESESKYPVKVSGLILLNGFVNTGNVDMPAAPTVALPGQGSTGASMRQTVLGIEARGPHVFGARQPRGCERGFLWQHGHDRRVLDGGTAATANGACGTGMEQHGVVLRAGSAADESRTADVADSGGESAVGVVGKSVDVESGAGRASRSALGGTARFRMQGALVDVADPPYTAAGVAVSVLVGGAEPLAWGTGAAGDGDGHGGARISTGSGRVFYEAPDTLWIELRFMGGDAGLSAAPAWRSGTEREFLSRIGTRWVGWRRLQGLRNTAGPGPSWAFLCAGTR